MQYMLMSTHFVSSLHCFPFATPTETWLNAFCFCFLQYSFPPPPPPCFSFLIELHPATLLIIRAIVSQSLVLWSWVRIYFSGTTLCYNPKSLFRWIRKDRTQDVLYHTNIIRYILIITYFRRKIFRFLN